MMNNPHDPANTELASNFTVRDYENARDHHPPDCNTIAEAIRRRFTDRYIQPVSRIPNSDCPKHGFTMMAVSCLMIESLESFRKGWETTKGRSEAAFCSFFDASEPFREFRGYANSFYTHVRCGILHQAETTGGWRIRRGESPLFDAEASTVNAEKFLSTLKQVLDNYCESLKTADWNSSEWDNARKKMDSIRSNCQTAKKPLVRVTK